jgi:hypothetical protein
MNHNIVIDDQLINLDKVHFVRRESENELLVSFGTDFLRFRGNRKKIESIFAKLQDGNNEELSGECKR